MASDKALRFLAVRETFKSYRNINISHGLTYYLSNPGKIIEYNLLVISLIKVKKVDNANVLSYGKILDVIGRCENAEGDIYDKAVHLLKGLVQ